MSKAIDKEATMRVGEQDCRRVCDELVKERGLNRKDFYGNTRWKEYVAARVEAIERMKAQTAASHTTIAVVLNKNVSIVHYHLSDASKLRRKIYYAARWKRLKALSASTTSSGTEATA